MGTFEVNVRVLSLDGAEYEDTVMLVDTGATFSLMPASTLHRLGVNEQVQIEVEYASGQRSTVPVGWALMEIDGFSDRLPAMIVFGHEDAQPLLGAHALEAFRLTVDPIDQTLRRRTALLM